MTLIRDAAFAYAARGWPVLALHTNTEEGCTCRSARCKSPGKHPRQDLSPKGVQSASTDPKIIAEWPDGVNIGVALGGDGLMAFDVDDREAAALLLAPDMVLSDETGVVVTGRPGAHVYFTCSGDTRTRHLNGVGGNKIGEIRGLGSYVVAPPSIAPSLKPYRWVGRPHDNFTPELSTTTDALAYIKELLRVVGVVVVSAGAATGDTLKPLKGVSLVDIELPPQLATDQTLMRVRQIMSGTLPKTREPDRSGQLFRLVREVTDAALRCRLNMDSEQLAGIAKRADIVYYDKYVGHRSESAADEALRGLALKAMRAAKDAYTGPRHRSNAGADDGDTPDGDNPPTSNVASVTYTWDAVAGQLNHVIPRGKGTSYQPVANFLPTLLAEITVDRGGEDTEVVWRVQFQLQDGRAQVLELHSADYESSYALEKALSRMIGSEYIVHAGQYKHLKPALQELTPPEKVERYKRRAVPGWHEFGMGRVFLMPGIRGALGVNGIDTSVRMRDEEPIDEQDPINDPSLAGYGKGVRVPANPEERVLAWDALEALVDSGKHEVTIPIVFQVLAGPLRAAGAGKVPPLVHAVGMTGSLKTSFCLAVLSLFGTFEETAPVSWLSTSPTVLRSLLYSAKDLTFLVDDYKEGAGVNREGLLEIVQNYADKTPRRRATPSGKRRKAEPPRCILLSNGEDRWDRQASSVARTIVVDVGEHDIPGPQLRIAQDMVKAGVTPLFGGGFIQWLAGQDDLYDNQEIDTMRETLFQRMLTQYQGPPAHRRILQSVATLLAVGYILKRYARETAPEREEVVLGWLRTVWGYFLAGVRERAGEVAALSPFRQLTGYIANAMAARGACLFPKDGMDADHHRRPATPGADVVGWWSEDGNGKAYVHLSESRTFSWYKVELRRHGDSPQFGWQSFVQEAVSEHQGTKGTRRFANDDGRHTQLKVVTILLDVLLNQHDEYAGLVD